MEHHPHRAHVNRKLSLIIIITRFILLYVLNELTPSAHRNELYAEKKKCEFIADWVCGKNHIQLLVWLNDWTYTDYKAHFEGSSQVSELKLQPMNDYK